MKTKKFMILLFTITGTLLIGGCEKQTVENTPEAAPELSDSSETPIDVDIISETVDSASTEPPTAPIPEQESTPQNTSPEEQKTDNATPRTQNTDHATSTTSETENTTSATVNVTKAFQPNDGWTSDFFFQVPKDWNYTVDEDTFEWGFLIQVNNQENATIRIYGQQGTVNVEQFYADAPTDFTTSSGLKGKYYQEKRTGEDGSSYIEGDIVFDLKLYGVHFYMPETIYNEYKDTLNAIFLSLQIKDIIAE